MPVVIWIGGKPLVSFCVSGSIILFITIEMTAIGQYLLELWSPFVKKTSDLVTYHIYNGISEASGSYIESAWG